MKYTRPVSSTEETYLCEKTGFRFIVWRVKGNKRSKGHLKNLFCDGCQKEHNLIKVEEN